MPKSEDFNATPDESESAATSRRELLVKFGRYAGAATPAMLLLLDANRQSAQAAGWWWWRPRKKRRGDHDDKHEASKPLSYGS
jgi:hypothetical protein